MEEVEDRIYDSDSNLSSMSASSAASNLSQGFSLVEGKVKKRARGLGPDKKLSSQPLVESRLRKKQKLKRKASTSPAKQEEADHQPPKTTAQPQLTARDEQCNNV